MPDFRVSGQVKTDLGCVRQLNEDSVLARPELGLWAVADGMGGHAHGDWASQHIVGELDKVVRTDFDRQLTAATDAILNANDHILAEGAARGAQMGSTVVMLMVGDGRFAIAWAGDSRAYLRRADTLYQLTVDHTQVQHLVERGLLSPDEVEGHPMGHVLTRAVGVDAGLALDVVTDTIQAGDVFLLCTDGLTNQVSDQEIADVLGAHAPDAAPALLIEMSCSRGAPDNVSVATVEVREMTVLQFAGGGEDLP